MTYIVSCHLLAYACLVADRIAGYKIDNFYVQLYPEGVLLERLGRSVQPTSQIS